MYLFPESLHGFFNMSLFLKIALFLPCFIWSTGEEMPAEKLPVYQKNYFTNKQLSSEGWMLNGKKTKYWKFYNPYGTLTAEGHFLKGKKCKYWFQYHFNGKVKSEGHYKDDEKVDWWNHYNQKGELVEKCQYKDNRPHGYRVLLTKEKPYKVELYERGVKQKEWTSYTRFLFDHPELLGT